MERTLEGLLEYFDELHPEQIVQHKSTLSLEEYEEAGYEPRGCFGVHSAYYFEPEKLDDYPDLSWDFIVGKRLNRKLLGLHEKDIVEAWQRLDEEEGRPYDPYIVIDPYGGSTWPFTPVETLREIIRFRKEGN